MLSLPSPSQEIFVFPSLPWEVICAIFSHCDQATLGSVSRVSFDCLAATATWLYEDITLSNEHALAILCRLPVSSSMPLPRCARPGQLTPSLWLVSCLDLTSTPATPPTTATTHPNGPPSLPPNRLKPHLSRSLIHSLTYTGLSSTSPRWLKHAPTTGPASPFNYLNCIAYVPVLRPPVLVLDLRGAKGKHEINTLMTLISPETFIALGGPSEGAAMNPDDWPVLDLGTRTEYPWDSLRTVLLSGGAKLEGYDQLRAEYASETALRVVVDLLITPTPTTTTTAPPPLTATTKDEQEEALIRELALINTSVLQSVLGGRQGDNNNDSNPEFDHIPIQIRAWVSSPSLHSALSLALADERGEWPFDRARWYDEKTFVDLVSSARMLQFRDDVHGKGVYKKIDWAALDEIGGEMEEGPTDRRLARKYNDEVGDGGFGLFD